METHLLSGDFRNLFRTLRADSIDLVLTDPPYGRAEPEIAERLALESARVLKPGGWFVCYLGHLSLPRTIPALSQRLAYFWTFTVLFRSPYVQRSAGISTGCNLVGVFFKPPRRPLSSSLIDVIAGGGREKTFHPWQKPQGEVRRLVETFSKPGAWILDPCAGSATTLAAAAESGRNSIGFELERDTFTRAKARLESGSLKVLSGPKLVVPSGPQEGENTGVRP